MNFINTLETVLKQLIARGWKVDIDIDDSGNYYDYFESAGASPDSSVVRWCATSHNGYGPDILYCRDVNWLHIEYDRDGSLETVMSGNSDEIPLTESELLDLLFDAARSSAASNA